MHQDGPRPSSPPAGRSIRSRLLLTLLAGVVALSGLIAGLETLTARAVVPAPAPQPAPDGVPAPDVAPPPVALPTPAPVPTSTKTLIIAKSLPNPHYGIPYWGTPFQVTLQGWPGTSVGPLTISEERSAMVTVTGAFLPFTVTIQETIPDSDAEYIYYGWKPGTWTGSWGPTSTPIVNCPVFDPATEMNPVPPTVTFDQPGDEVEVVCLYNGLFAKLTKSVSAPVVRPGDTFFWDLDLRVYEPLRTPIILADELPLWELYLSPQGGFIYGTPIFTPQAAFQCAVAPPLPALGCWLPEGTPPGRYSIQIPVTVPTGTFAVCDRFVNKAKWSSFVPLGNPPRDVKPLVQNSNEVAVEVVCGSDGVVATSGTLHVAKVVRGQPGDTTSFTATISGPGISGSASQPFSQQRPAILPGLAAGTFTLSEAPQAPYTYAGWAYGTVEGASVQCPANPTSSAAAATVTLTNVAPQAVVCFYNDPPVNIVVHKVLNALGTTSNGAGWQFTLTGCGVTPQTKTTGADGKATFSDLPPAVGCSYTVTETVQAGWTPQSVSQTAQPTRGGETVTLTFVNSWDWNPRCIDPMEPGCSEPPRTPTPTPTPPAGTPTPPAGTPTPTPTTPAATSTPTATPTNTPVTQVAGERTPGPGGSPTPLAPATGFGPGQGQGSVSLLLVLAGLVSLGLGLSFLALGRRSR